MGGSRKATQDTGEGAMTALVIIGTVFAVTLYICIVAKISLWASDLVFYTRWRWTVYAVTAMTLLISPIAILIEVAT